MLIEIWERLRGYDKWIQVDARVESSNLQETKNYDRSGNQIESSWESDDEIVWTDNMGQEQRADFNVPDDSPIYQLVGGETVTIRYNPAKPEEFYYRELLRTRVHTAFKLTLICGCLIGFFLLIFILRILGIAGVRSR
jgi:uncharacterized protein DUF3592